MDAQTLNCPHCGNIVDSNHKLQNRRVHESRGHCLRCGISFPLQFRSSRKRLIYLDQSFLSDVFLTTERSDHYETVTRLFSKLNKLKTLKKVFLVISDIHCVETTGIHEQHSEKRKGLWQFQNQLADGAISGDWADVFVSQHRRLLKDGSTAFPISDIGLEAIYKQQSIGGMQVISTNVWRQKLHSQLTPPSDEMNSHLLRVIEHLASNMPLCPSEHDCLKYLRENWQKEIEQSISATLALEDFFKQIGEYSGAAQLASLQIPQRPETPIFGIVGEVVRHLDKTNVLRHWSELLHTNSIGPCLSIRIRTAFEAVLLMTWSLGQRQNPKKFSQNFGVSRQNDINHISVFVPYVDALTTDKDMHNLCKRSIVTEELCQFPCRIFSKNNYGDFENWLNELLECPEK